MLKNDRILSHRNDILVDLNVFQNFELGVSCIPPRGTNAPRILLFMTTRGADNIGAFRVLASSALSSELPSQETVDSKFVSESINIEFARCHLLSPKLRKEIVLLPHLGGYRKRCQKIVCRLPTEDNYC